MLRPFSDHSQDDLSREGPASGEAENRIGGQLDLIERFLVQKSESGAAVRADSDCAVTEVVKSEGFEPGLMPTPEVGSDRASQAALARLAALCPGRLDAEQGDPKSPGTAVE